MQNAKGETILHMCIYNYETVEYLLSLDEMDVNITTNAGRTAYSLLYEMSQKDNYDGYREFIVREIYSHTFDDILELFNKRKEIDKLKEKYQPGGKGYTEAKKRFETNDY